MLALGSRTAVSLPAIVTVQASSRPRTCPD